MNRVTRKILLDFDLYWDEARLWRKPFVDMFAGRWASARQIERYADENIEIDF